MRAPARRRPESRFARCIALHFDSRQKPRRWLFFWQNFLRKFGQNWNPLRRAASCPVHRAGSRAASRFTSIPDKSHAGGFFSGKIFYENLARTGILSGGQQAVPSIEPVRALHRASLRFQTKATQVAFFLAKFSTKIWPELESSQAGSKLSRPSSRFARCIALHFDSRQKPRRWLFFWQNFLRKFGQNWNRTSDTRIFSPLLYRLSYLAK